MFAVDAVRRAAARYRASSSASMAGPLPHSAVVVSNVSTFGGGGAVGFRDILLALRKLQPDLDIVAVYPRMGNLAADCSKHGVETKIAWTPWWAFGKWRRARGLDALVGWLPYAAVLLPGIANAVWLLARLQPAMVLSNTMVIPSHAIAAKFLGIPHYWIVREFGRDDHQLWFLLGYRRTVRLISRLSTRVICNSHAVEQAMLALEPTMTTAVVYPVVETPLGGPPQRLPGEPMRVILVGYFSYAKGQHLAIEAIAIARQSGVDIGLALVGSGSQRPLRKLAQRLGVADLVSFHGPTPDLGGHWATAHVGLMCSECEAFGRVTVEAMRAGLPVCGTRSGGTPEIIEHGVNGLLSTAGDAQSLADNLMSLESGEPLRRALASGALKTSQRFQRDRHDDELATILGLR